MRHAEFVISVSSALLLWGCAMLAAHQDRPAPSRAPHYVPRELIVRLAPEAGQQLDAALRAGHPPTATGLHWLDALNARYGVTAIEPVFSQQRDLETVRRKYPTRARRAPAGVQSPNLASVYQLTLRPGASVLEAAHEYAQQPGVEYAQPNYVVTTQDSPGPSP